VTGTAKSFIWVSLCLRVGLTLPIADRHVGTGTFFLPRKDSLRVGDSCTLTGLKTSKRWEERH
jgi:hypothetical protein